MTGTTLREVSLAAERIEDVADGIAAITGHPGFEIQKEAMPPIQARFRSYAVGDRSIAVMDSLGEPTAISRFLARRGPGAFSLTLGVDDLEATSARLRQAGARLLLDEPLTLSQVRSGSQRFDRIRLNFVTPNRLTHGLVVELQELHGGREAALPDVSRDASTPIALNEVHCAVTDVDGAARDLERLFAFDVGPEVTQVQPPEEVRFRNLSLAGRPVLALIQPATTTSSIHRFLARRGEGIFSVSFRVGDVVAYAERVRRAGVATLFDEPKQAHATRIGPAAIAAARIHWVRPQPLSDRVLFETQQYEGA